MGDEVWRKGWSLGAGGSPGVVGTSLVKEAGEAAKRHNYRQLETISGGGVLGDGEGGGARLGAGGGRVSGVGHLSLLRLHKELHLSEEGQP